jgi:predicted transcriptional regulator
MKYKKWTLDQKLEILSSREEIDIVDAFRKAATQIIPIDNKFKSSESYQVKDSAVLNYYPCCHLALFHSFDFQRILSNVENIVYFNPIFLSINPINNLVVLFVKNISKLNFSIF